MLQTQSLHFKNTRGRVQAINRKQLLDLVKEVVKQHGLDTLVHGGLDGITVGFMGDSVTVGFERSFGIEARFSLTNGNDGRSWHEKVEDLEFDGTVIRYTPNIDFGFPSTNHSLASFTSMIDLMERVKNCGVDIVSQLEQVNALILQETTPEE